MPGEGVPSSCPISLTPSSALSFRSSWQTESSPLLMLLPRLTRSLLTMCAAWARRCWLEHPRWLPAVPLVASHGSTRWPRSLHRCALFRSPWPRPGLSIIGIKTFCSVAETLCISLLLQTTNVWLAMLLLVAVLAAVALPGGAGRGHAQSYAERLLLRLQGAGVQAPNLGGGWVVEDE